MSLKNQQEWEHVGVCITYIQSIPSFPLLQGLRKLLKKSTQQESPMKIIIIIRKKVNINQQNWTWNNWFKIGKGVQ